MIKKSNLVAGMACSKMRGDQKSMSDKVFIGDSTPAIFAKC